jgi:16S rRNA (cytosine967-C5)-methyltransferase
MGRHRDTGTRAVVVSPRAVTRRSYGARGIAAVVLARVEEDGAFASAALDAELGRSIQLDARDRALATELVYGSLRVLPWLKQELARFAPRGIAALDARVRGHLVLAAYQLFFTRVPAFAAVNEAVDAIRSERGTRVASFANACLRKLATRAASIDAETKAQAVVESAPPWLRDALSRVFSPEQTNAFLQSAIEPPAAVLRVEHAAERDAWLERLRQAVPRGTFEPGRWSPHAILARGAGKLHELPGWEAGAWSIQEEGAQLVTLAVGARPGEAILDACAGRGNKTALLARSVGVGAGHVDACDVSAAKLDRMTEELRRLDLRTRRAFAVDWTLGSGDVAGSYDRILVDAPCTGVGTLRRRPEIALRLPPDLGSIARVQLAIASHAAEHLRPGGVIVYVVCSVLREEGEDIATALAQAHPELDAAPFEAPVIRGLFGDVPRFRLLPQAHGTDGYFAAKFVRRS